MRMRKKKHGAERIEACSDLLLQNTAICAENIPEIFKRDKNCQNPLWLEIGCGKGDFVCGMAERYPDSDLIALERIPDVAMLAMEKCKAKDNYTLSDVFEYDEMARQAVRESVK